MPGGGLGDAQVRCDGGVGQLVDDAQFHGGPRLVGQLAQRFGEATPHVVETGTDFDLAQERLRDRRTFKAEPLDGTLLGVAAAMERRELRPRDRVERPRSSVLSHRGAKCDSAA